MIDPSLHPSRQLRFLASVARWSLRLVVAFWLVLTVVWLTLHFFIVPRIGDWRGEVERLATQALGAPTRIASITGHSNGLFPTIHLQGVQVLDAQERVALELHSVVATLSARSVLRLGLEQLYIDAPVLDVRHLVDGRWQIAGLDVAHTGNSEGASLDWLLEQPELFIRNGQITLTDEQRSAQAVQWKGVDFVMRNRHWSHVLRIDAAIDPASSERVQLIGAFRQPLLPSSKAAWTRWSGQWYASVKLDQLPPFPWPKAWPLDKIEGHGLVRAWVDVHEGKPFALTLDAALPSVAVQWKVPHLPALQMQQVQGRLEALEQPNSWQVSAQNFGFQYGSTGKWPASNWQIQRSLPQSGAANTALDLSFADIAVASQVAQSLPLPPHLQARLTNLQPEGQLHQLHVQWNAGGEYQAQGQVKRLTLQPQASPAGVGTPGLQGLDARFDLNAQGGTAEVTMQAGALHFPGVFEDPSIPMDSLQAKLQWHLDKEDVKIQVQEAVFANADAQGRLHGFWETGSTTQARLPGYLHLEGELARADGKRVHRYLPLQIPAQARHYVRDSVQGGQGQQVAFEVRGNLHEMPFASPSSGRFWIKAPLKGVSYAYVPPSFTGPGQPGWPALKDLQGDLIFEGASMRVENAATGFTGHPQLHMQAVSAHISDLKHPRVAVKAEGVSPLDAALGLTRQSPLAGFTSHALNSAKAEGQAQIAFALDLPIDHLEQSKVAGSVSFLNSSLQLTAHTPRLRQLQGTVQFHEQGFNLANVHGHGLGGTFQASGGMPSAQQGTHVHVEGIATAQGMQQDSALAVVQQLAKYAEGQTRYSAEITAQSGRQNVLVRSDLKGLALQLPTPLGKHAEERIALTVAHALLPEDVQDLKVDVGSRARVWMRQTGDANASKAVHAYVGLGNTTMPNVLASGVVADINLPLLDVDAWMHALDAYPSPSFSAEESGATWLPSQIQAKVGQLHWQGRSLDALTANIQQQHGIWKGTLQAKQLAGDVEYRHQLPHTGTGLVFARLSRLSLPKADAQKMDQVIVGEPTQTLDALPALDIEVEKLEIAGRALGKLQLQAKNTVGAWGRDWLLERFDLETPEARWKASGYWGRASASAPSTTKMSFLLDVDSSGKLLERFGMPGVIRDGQGRLSGNIAWQGSPIAPDWKTMDGGVQMQVEKGQFLKVEPGIGKLLSVLSLQSLTRRINLDFRDVFSQGFAFDFIRGDIGVAQGIARTNNLQMKGLNAAVLMEGQASLIDETQSLKVVVVPEINAMTASLAATAINPVIGVGSFLAQMFLRGPLMEAATRTFHVRGTWTDPVVETVRKDAQTGVSGMQEAHP